MKPIASGLIAVVVVLVLAAMPAQAAEVSRFFGHFEGSGISENADSLYFEVTVRDLDVVIRPEADGAFRIDWTTITRNSGDPNDPTEKKKNASIVFHPTDRPGVYRGATGGGLLDGAPFWWSRIEDNTLYTYMIVIGKDGRWQVQKYARTVSGEGMSLVFDRIVDGEPQRQVKARLVKVGD